MLGSPEAPWAGMHSCSKMTSYFFYMKNYLSSVSFYSFQELHTWFHIFHVLCCAHSVMSNSLQPHGL